MTLALALELGSDRAGLPPDGLGFPCVWSPGRVHRHVLWRSWAPYAGRFLLWCGLNPSVANEEINDPTITREVNFTKVAGYTAMAKVNLAGFCATDPPDMLRAADPWGADNAMWLHRLAHHPDCGGVVAAWGPGANRLPRAGYELQTLALRAPHERPLLCLGTSKDGSPRHPLMVKNGVPLRPWAGVRAL